MSSLILSALLQDDDPELEEVFVVRLISVALVGGADGSVPPTLGTASVAEVTIAPNDSPRGIITFLQQSYMVQEDVGRVEIVIAREQGTAGQVSVVYGIINMRAMNGEDFMIEPLDDVVFAEGQASASLNIPILNDSDPEIEEEFCVALSLARDGAALGNLTRSKGHTYIHTYIHTYMYVCMYVCMHTYIFISSFFVSACVTILPNDDAYGVFSFSPDSLRISLQETQGIAAAVNGMHLTATMRLRARLSTLT